MSATPARNPQPDTATQPNRQEEPPYIPPTYPLNEKNQTELTNILQNNNNVLRRLKTYLQHASEKLADSAGEVNERLTDAKGRYQRKKEKKGGGAGGDEDGDGDGEEGGGGEEDNEYQDLARTEERVKTVTEELERGMRGVIDAEVKTDEFEEVVKALGREEIRRGEREDQGRRGRGAEEGDDAEEGDNEGGDEHKPNFHPASKKLEERLAEAYASWEGQSLTQRYSRNNTYIGFYRVVHESKHPSDATPPLPHASTWFSHLENPNARPRPRPRTGTANNNQNEQTTETLANESNNNDNDDDEANGDENENENDEDDEIAIERERISLKCPLTLLTFQDPVTSTKCRHSFERQAIQDMISRSPMTVPENPENSISRNRLKAVKCPVCAVAVSMRDFVADVALARRVRRAEAVSQREEADRELEGASGKKRRAKGTRKSGITVASDGSEGSEDEDEGEDADADDVGDGEQEGRRVRVKRERADAHANVD